MFIIIVPQVFVVKNEHPWFCKGYVRIFNGYFTFL
jgi:hypothetical protein